MKRSICLLLALIFALSMGACVGGGTHVTEPESSAAPESPSESDETTWLTPETSDLGPDSETIDAITGILTSGHAVTSEDQSEQSGTFTDIDTPTDTGEITSENTSEITSESKDPVITTTPEVTTDPPVVTTKPVETTDPPVVTTEPPVVTTQPVETTEPDVTTYPLGTAPPKDPPIIPDVTMPVVEPERDVVVTVKSRDEYKRHVPTWDGKTLIFWDGRTATAPEDGKLIIKDESGNVIDYYIARSNSNIPGDLPEDFKITRVRYDGNTTLLYMNNSEDFENNRPIWDGKVVKFSDNYYFKLENEERLLILNPKGQTFADYQQDRYIIDEVPYYVGRYILDGATHIIISDPKYLYDENGNIKVTCKKMNNNIIVSFTDYPTVQHYSQDSAICVCDLDGNVYYSYNMLNPVDKHAVPNFIKEKYEEAVK